MTGGPGGQDGRQLSRRRLLAAAGGAGGVGLAGCQRETLSDYLDTRYVAEKAVARPAAVERSEYALAAARWNLQRRELDVPSRFEDPEATATLASHLTAYVGDRTDGSLTDDAVLLFSTPLVEVEGTPVNPLIRLEPDPLLRLLVPRIPGDGDLGTVTFQETLPSVWPSEVARFTATVEYETGSQAVDIYQVTNAHCADYLVFLAMVPPDVEWRRVRQVFDWVYHPACRVPAESSLSIDGNPVVGTPETVEVVDQTFPEQPSLAGDDVEASSPGDRPRLTLRNESDEDAELVVWVYQNGRLVETATVEVPGEDTGEVEFVYRVYDDVLEVDIPRPQEAVSGGRRRLPDGSSVREELEEAASGDVPDPGEDPPELPGPEACDRAYMYYEEGPEEGCLALDLHLGESDT